jgi:alkanesulfonate monooxygenase SsuD/methylene tetrahydromethanopterin reductase-like flavin-dependent oxidoreductase (luciferase family)
MARWALRLRLVIFDFAHVPRTHWLLQRHGIGSLSPAELVQSGRAEIGRHGPAPSGRERDYQPDGMGFAGGPNQIAERFPHLLQLLGHARQILQMDVGGMAQAAFLQSIELLGNEVPPRIRKELTS